MKQRKLLVYNIMQYPDKIRFFNEGIEREAIEAGMDAEYIIPLKPDILSRVDEFSHLIISGSEESAMENSVWTEELTELIHLWVAKKKKILGICYGHQFLAGVLAGKECLFRLPVPEYGYTKVRLKENKLFRNINKPTCLQLHYDAVRILPDEFTVIAEHDTCIQGFQYRDMDVYGLQFHPEFGKEAGEYFLKEAAENDPNFPNFFRNELNDTRVLDQNRLFVRNFLMI